MKLLLQDDKEINYPFLIFKWLLICSLNSVVSFVFAFTSEYEKLYDIISMLLGIITFVFLYTYLEISMMKKGEITRQKIMFFGVIAHLPLQLFPVVDMVLGLLSIGLIKELLQIGYPFNVYLITLTQGLFLSVICFILGVLLYWIYIQIQNRKHP